MKRGRGQRRRREKAGQNLADIFWAIKKQGHYLVPKFAKRTENQSNIPTEIRKVGTGGDT